MGDAIILDVVIFGVNLNFVGFVGKNMNLHIIGIHYLCVLVWLEVIYKEK